jgi:HD superfamily phosphohydrolase
MSKRIHEVRDPVHIFIRYDSDERKVIDSEPFQRLRYIHQLAMTFLVYPGATHRRFEHSLGVMELASRIFDSITRPDNLYYLPSEIRDQFPALEDLSKRGYWRRVLRLAALCHDLGHLPFSHAAENLLPKGYSHETMTKIIILELMKDVWSRLDDPKPRPEDIAKIAVGPEEAKDLGRFSTWEAILSEIIVGDVFGADRMDYLLRDSLHAGVTYGHFDHHRLIDTMRILPGPPADASQEYDSEPALGIEIGGLQVAESLLVARYLMFSQVYCHHVRRIYDIHLKEFLQEVLPDGVYPTEPNQFIKTTDNEILTLIHQAACDGNSPGHIPAKLIHTRQHFKKAYMASIQDIEKNPNILEEIRSGLAQEIGANDIRLDDYAKGTALKLKSNFPIRMDDGRIVSAFGASSVLRSLPPAMAKYVFVTPEKRNKACAWVEKNLNMALANTKRDQNA